MRLIALLLLVLTAATGCARVSTRALWEEEYCEGMRDLRESVQTFTAAFPTE